MNVSIAEEAAMTRALELAAQGPRSRNPQVGAVIIAPDGTILAEGYHRGAGTAHAEVDALSQLSPEQTAGATAVVTLEPCNHTGRTGPCALALIEAGISRVIFAVDDPGEASGGGAERLRTAGVDVVSGIANEPASALIAEWIETARRGRPRVTVKWAQSLDGRAAADDGTSQWITGPEARADVHQRRAEHDAILAGIGTIIADDAALTARDGDSLLASQPVPVVVGSRDIPTGSRVLAHLHAVIHERTHDLNAVLDDLFDRGLYSVFVEGGPTVAGAFLAAGLVDDVLVYTAPLLLGGSRTATGSLGISTLSEAIRLTAPTYVPLGDDLLIHARTAPRSADQHHTGKKPPMTSEPTVSLATVANVPTVHGMFRFLAYTDSVAQTEHLAIVSGELSDTALVRVHSECLTGEAFGSLKCECGPQLDAAMAAIAAEGGIVIYMRGQEGRGIGLLNKLRAYALQEQGLDTLDANLALGLPADARDYTAAVRILENLGVSHVRLLTNNTDKVRQLENLGVTVIEQVPLVVGVAPENEGYLETKRARMGHVIPESLLHPTAE